MFFASLVLAGIQLVCAVCVFALARARTVARLIAATLGSFIGSMVLFAMSPVLLLQGMALAAIGIVCLCAKARCRVFLVWAVVATLIILSGVGGQSVLSWSRLKERYPFESMSARLAYKAPAGDASNSGRSVRSALTATVLPQATLARLSEAEENQRRSWRRRGESLRLLHASYVEQFVESPGFGVGRVIRPSAYQIEYGDRRSQLRIPLDWRPDLDGSDDPGVYEIPGLLAAGSVPAGQLAELHNEARGDFLDPETFGYFRDRDHVAGFMPHGFSNKVWLRSGKSGQRWLTVRLELVSLLKHEQPMVYVSDHLPNMTELRHVPVRSLDAFEQQGLASLIAGEDLVSDVQAGRIVALGSLRAMRQCLDCHRVDRGTLLGAFSYEFLRDPPAPQPTADADSDGEKIL